MSQNSPFYSLKLFSLFHFIFAHASLYRNHPFSGKVGRAAAGVLRRGILPVHFPSAHFLSVTIRTSDNHWSYLTAEVNRVQVRLHFSIRLHVVVVRHGTTLSRSPGFPLPWFPFNV